MSDKNEAVTELYPEIQRAAKKIANEWSDVVEADDLTNDIVIRLLEGNKGYAVTLREMDIPQRTKTLNMIASQLASEARDTYEYFHGNFRYSLEEVRQLLRGGALFHVGQEVVANRFNRSEDGAGGERLQPQGFKEPKVRDQTENLDVGVCFRSLSENHQRVLVAAYLTGSYSGHHQRVTEAEEALMHAMNRNFRTAKTNHDGPGSRKAISNAQAAVINKRQTED